MVSSMNEKLLIVGAGGFGRVVSEHAVKEYECSFVDDGYEVGTKICGHFLQSISCLL